MPDVRLVQNTLFPKYSVTIDWSLLADGTLDETQALATAVIVALGTDRRRSRATSCPIRIRMIGGWWGDSTRGDLGRLADRHAAVDLRRDKIAVRRAKAPPWCRSRAIHPGSHPAVPRPPHWTRMFVEATRVDRAHRCFRAHLSRPRVEIELRCQFSGAADRRRRRLRHRASHQPALGDLGARRSL
jgi:hypothetical protein